MRALKIISSQWMLALVIFVATGLTFLLSSEANAALSVTPSTWNVIGLDSNGPLTGPNRFPVGVEVCSTTAATDVVVDFVWDSSNTYIYLRPGSQSSITIPSIGAGACADAYFEVEVERNAAAFDEVRRYHITAGGASTPTPREFYVERLISQNRNYITNVKVDGASVPAGGYMNLVVGQTYTIELYGGTATQGYNQFEEFINFPNTIFQILSVSTLYSATTSIYHTNPHDKLYADACLWENDPNSPYYLSCVGGGYKSGGSTVVTTYTVKIISGGGGTETLNTLLYDFSGSSFHYNADYPTGARFANIIDPTTVNISKRFSPNPTNVGGVSMLTFTLTNPNAGAVNGVSFTDDLPAVPAAMVVATPAGATTNGCGTPTFAPNAGDASISFSGGSIAANSSCTVKVNVAPPATGTYVNTSNNLFVGAVDTGKTASDSLVVNNAPVPPPPPSDCPGQEVELARWTMDPAQGESVPPLPFYRASDVATATTSYTSASGAQTISTAQGNPINSWGGTAPTGGGGWAETDTSEFNYFQFELDTSKYNGVTVTFDVGLYLNADWASPNSDIYVNTNADGGPFTVYNISAGIYPSGSKGSWTTGLYAEAATTGTNTTIFRFSTTGAGSNKPNATMYLDNVIFSGCIAPDPPTITKAFSPNPVAVGAASTLTFTVTNPNAGAALSGVAFTDSLPTGLTVANNSSAQCGGGTLTTTNPDTISFAGGTLAAGVNCAITATVTAATAGPHDNVSGFVNATETGDNIDSTGIATASLTAVSPPGISKQFAPNPILAGGVSTLTFIITNPNQNNALSGVAFADTFPVAPASMVVAAAPNETTSGCGTPTFAPNATDVSISFSDGIIAAGETCIVTVDVTAPTIGTYNNTSGDVSHDINAATVNGNTASASLTVEAASPQIALLKQVGPGPDPLNDPWTSFLAAVNGTDVYYKLTIENAGDAELDSIGVTDPDVNIAGCTWTDPLPVPVAANDDHIDTCVVGPITAVDGTHPNTATASGTYSASAYTDQSTAVYATTGLTIGKSATQTYFTAVADVLDYSYVVTNSGNAALVGPVTVADDKSADESCPAVSTVGDNDNYLDPGESITCTATYTIAVADVTAKLATNVASATADGVTSATDSVTVPMSSLTVVKFVTVYSDPINGVVSPKAIPGAEMVYTVTVTNTGRIVAGSITVTDPVPANTEFFAGDINGAGSGPVRFIEGAIASDLSYSFISLDSTVDDISFSDDNGATYDYEPAPDVDGFDANVTDLMISPTGIFNASDGTNDPSFDLKFKVKVK